MNEKERRVVLQYDVEALKENIARLDRDIKTWHEIVERSLKQGRRDQADMFIQAIKNAQLEQTKLRGYITLIKSETDGN